MTWPAKVLTVSDSVADGNRQDLAGPAVASTLSDAGFEVVQCRTVPDGIDPVTVALIELTEEFHGVVATTGGTGFGPSDLTPEATRQVMDRQAPGLAEAMRATNPLGRLTRGLAGTIGTALVINLPGSPRGAVESLEAILDVLPHVLDLLAGGRPH